MKGRGILEYGHSAASYRASLTMFKCTGEIHVSDDDESIVNLRLSARFSSIIAFP